MQPNVRDAIEETLRRRRCALIRDATEHETALRAMGEAPESELEEAAQDDQLNRVLSRLDDRERREIAEIDAALDRLADGTYGRCARCDGTIGAGRLAALPAAALCIRCAARREAAHTVTSETGPGVPLAERGALDDDEMEALVREAVEADRRIDHEELRISCRRGVVRLEGVLPSDGERAILRRIVEDVLGFRDVVDRVRIDEPPWERADRAKPAARRPPRFEPVGTDDVVESTEEGISFVPADRPPADEE